jgi:hypothetical protein
MNLSPKQIVQQLDKYIIGQDEAKKAVAIALRNRYRRAMLPQEVREEITPKNIIMKGPTGVGKTEIARRLAKLVKAPFVKVEATKYTEVGYVGKDVEGMIRELAECAYRLVKAEKEEEVKAKATVSAEQRLVKAIAEAKKNEKGDLAKEAFESRDFTTAEMLKSFTFWRAFACMAFITAVGNSVISFARDLAISVEATEALAVTLVGVLSVCNGLGRILTGALYDALGRRTTMIAANILTIVAAGITLVAVNLGSLPICIAGLCLTGLSYGSCPTLTSAFTSSFYGQKYFSVNYSLTNFNLIVAAFIAKFSNVLLAQYGSYTAPFMMLLVLAVCALGLNFSVKKP